jgi:hypothetical protein
MYFVAFGEQQLSEITPILSGNASDQCLLQKIERLSKWCFGSKKLLCMLAA